MKGISELLRDSVVISSIAICLSQVADSQAVVSITEENFGSVIVDLRDKVKKEVIEGRDRKEKYQGAECNGHRAKTGGQRPLRSLLFSPPTISLLHNTSSSIYGSICSSPLS